MDLLCLPADQRGSRVAQQTRTTRLLRGDQADTLHVALDAIKSTSEEEYEIEFAPKAYDSDQNIFAVQVGLHVN